MVQSGLVGLIPVIADLGVVPPSASRCQDFANSNRLYGNQHAFRCRVEGRLRTQQLHLILLRLCLFIDTEVFISCSSGASTFLLFNVTSNLNIFTSQEASPHPHQLTLITGREPVLLSVLPCFPDVLLGFILGAAATRR